MILAIAAIILLVILIIGLCVAIETSHGYFILGMIVALVCWAYIVGIAVWPVVRI